MAGGIDSDGVPGVPGVSVGKLVGEGPGGMGWAEGGVTGAGDTASGGEVTAHTGASRIGSTGKPQRNGQPPVTKEHCRNLSAAFSQLVHGQLV